VREAYGFARAGLLFFRSLGCAHPPGQERLRRRPEPRRVHEPIFALHDRLTEDLPAAPADDPERFPERGSDRDPGRPAEPLATGGGSDDWGL
jgi:hypothetical protein